MSDNANTIPTNAIDDAPHSKPIDIDPARGRQNRRRSESTSSSDSSPPLKTPSSPSRPTLSPSTSTSPILSYFLSQQSPTGTKFPFARSLGTAVEDDEDDLVEPPVGKHARRVSTGWNPGLFGAAGAAVPESQKDRGNGLLRRLSLGGAMRPNLTLDKRATSPPARMGTPPLKSSGLAQNPGTPRRPHRAATVGTMQGTKIPRSPSPMGERILKGHFDGFN